MEVMARKGLAAAVEIGCNRCVADGFFFRAYITTEEATKLRDQLNEVLDEPVQVTAEIVSEWARIDNSPRNPLALSDDALGENETPIAQADGDPGDCHVPLYGSQPNDLPGF